MQEPKTGDIRGLGRKLIETIDGGEDTGDGIGFFGDGRRGIGAGRSRIESLERVCHGLCSS